MLGLGQALDEFVGEMSLASDGEVLWTVLRDHVRSKGLRAVLYNPGPAVASISARARLPIELHADGFGAEWLDGLRNGAWGADAALRRCARASAPILWSRLAEQGDAADGLLAPGEAGAPPDAPYLEALRVHGGGDGVLFPLYSVGVRTGYLLAGFGGPAGRQSPAALRSLHCAAQIAHIVYCELSERRRRAGPLSPRELEVLVWIARGKSNAAIASILEVSYHTVDTMVRRIFAKLEAGDRTTATVKGLAAGLIDLPDTLN